MAQIQRVADPTNEQVQSPVAGCQPVDAQALRLPLNSKNFHKTPLARLAPAVLRIVQAEGPVHVAMVTTRLLAAASVGRAGARIQHSILSALNHLEPTERIWFNGEIAALPEPWATGEPCR